MNLGLQNGNLPSTMNTTVACTAQICVVFDTEHGHQLTIRFRQLNSPHGCAEVQAGTGAFNHFAPIRRGQLIAFETTVTMAYNAANTWFELGPAQLDLEDFERAVKWHACKAIEQEIC